MVAREVSDPSTPTRVELAAPAHDVACTLICYISIIREMLTSYELTLGHVY